MPTAGPGYGDTGKSSTDPGACSQGGQSTSEGCTLNQPYLGGSQGRLPGRNGLSPVT